MILSTFLKGDQAIMMGYQPPAQSKLFYHGVNIDKRVRANHPLRMIAEHIDREMVPIVRTVLGLK